MCDAPHISVILPCRNEAAHIEQCLRSILAQEIGGHAIEVLVADGTSDDGTREILQRLVAGSWKLEADGPTQVVGHPLAVVTSPLVRVIDNPGRIVSKGLNAAIRAAHGEIIIRLDAHTEYPPDYIGRCVDVLVKTGADNVGGPWVARGDKETSRAIAAAFQSPFAVGGARGHRSDYEGLVDTVYLGCWRRETFEKFGYFDEELVRNQDDEHNLRIIRGGGKIYQSPQIRSWYKPRGSLVALFKQYMQYGYWKVRVIQKHKLPASWRHLVPGAFVLTLAVLFLLSTFSFLFSLIFHLPSSIFNLPAAALLFTLCAYALALITASLITAAKCGLSLFPVLPLVFPCYHFGYGWGFLRGILDFVILRRGASASLTALTRNPPGAKAIVHADH